MLHQVKYEDLRSKLLPGDAFYFVGSGFVSDAIKLYTGGSLFGGPAVPSHRATVFQSYEPEMRVKLIESTTDPVAFDLAKPHSGVQISYASDRLASYDGSVYCAQLGPRERADFKLQPFLAFCAAMEGRPYDKGDIVRMALDPLHLFCCGDGYKDFICSQLGCALEKLEGILPAWVNSKTVTPADEVAFRIWADDYYQLRGRPAALKSFNSIDPLMWRGHAA